MLVKHVGLTCSSEENSDKFYQVLLGLNKLDSKTLPAELSRAIFNIDAELHIINYKDENLHFEIFISRQNNNRHPQIAHLCLEVEDLHGFIEKCRSMNLGVKQIPKGDKILTFIEDYDGNLFEIKPK